MAVYAVALMGVLWAATAPAPPAGAVRWALPVLGALTLALWWPLHAWAADGQDPWAWLAGLTTAAGALTGTWAGVVCAAVLAAAAAAGGVLFDRPVLTQLATALAVALGLWLMCLVVVWLLRLLVAADAERETRAELAVAQERLRLSRELHDVLGHRLGIISLKAELTAGLARRDPAGAATEADDIRRLASETLAESRRAIHDESTVDLAAQLGAAELVLSSAGIATTVEACPHDVADLPEGLSRLLAAVVRESVTNVLRHSDAREVTIGLTGSGVEGRPHGILRIVNDQAREADPTGRPAGAGTGLAALSARCSAQGARLVAGPAGGGTFEVRVDLLPEGARR